MRLLNRLFYLAELVLAECRMLMADKLPLPLNNLGPSDPNILLQILPMLQQETSEQDDRLGSNQEYQSLSSSAIFVRLLDRTLPVPPVADQFETKLTPGQWL